jgi:cyclophilin family peptidyl-prolyl cis-trans isomerase
MKKTVVFMLMLCFLAGCAITGKQGKSRKEELVTISTELGDMKLILFDDTPLHKENFLKLAESGYYDGTTFHRIVKGFMIQGGDPNSKDDNPRNDGQGGPGHRVPAELNTNHKHTHGAVAAARLGDNVNPARESSGSQFYIVESKNGTPYLDKKYTVFGRVIDGLDVITKIAEQEKDRMDRPVKDIKMNVSVKKVAKKKLNKQYGLDLS